MKFKKIAVAVAFSPRCEALLSEAFRLKKLFEAELVIIHIGEKTAQDEDHMFRILLNSGLNTEKLKVVWQKGDPAKKILEVCKEEGVDLLIAGALKKENLLDYYIGTVARKILRKAQCSVLVLLDPSVQGHVFNEIVISGEDGVFTEQVIGIGCMIGRAENSKQLHVITGLKMYGLTMSMASEQSEEEYSDVRKELVAKEINKIQEMVDRSEPGGLKINIKVVAGKTGYELACFSDKVKADLLVMSGPEAPLGFFSRLFSSDLEYIFSEIPSNLLIVNPKKSNTDV